MKRLATLRPPRRLIRALATDRYTHGRHATQHSARTAENSAALLLLHLADQQSIGTAAGAAGNVVDGVSSGDTGGVSDAAASSRETRCAHCFITFATPTELVHHTTHHCFPEDPTEVLRRYPAGVEALDTVNRQRVVVLGEATNRRSAHSAVSARYVARRLVADVPISRLQLVGRRFVTRHVCNAARSGSGQPSYRTVPLIEIPRAGVSAVARLVANGSARYLDCRSEGEVGGGVVPGSVNIPFPHNGNAEIVEPAAFLVDVDHEGFERDQPIVVGCRTGARSALAAEVLIQAGFRKVSSADGGVLAWVAAGLPIEPYAG